MTPLEAMLAELQALVARIRTEAARQSVQDNLGLEGQFAAPPPPTQRSVVAPAGYQLKVKPCRDCGGSICWGIFGNDKPAIIEPDSLREGGFDVRAGKFGPVPHFEKSRGHRLHNCAQRGE